MSVVTYHFSLQDADFGEVYVRRNSRAKNIIFRIVNGSILVTVPELCNKEDIPQYIDRNRQQLQQMLKRNEQEKLANEIDLSFRIQTSAFIFSIRSDNEFSVNTDSTSSPYSAVMSLPSSFACEKHQKWLEQTIIKVIYNFSLTYLPIVLRQMSQVSGLNYESLELGTAHTHWGTCRRLSNKRKSLLQQRPHTALVDIGRYAEEEKYPHKIVLSAYTALLPVSLTRFILLHELTHTRHPDHSAAFHTTLNMLTVAVLGLTENECQKQMKNYHTNIFSFAKQ